MNLRKFIWKQISLFLIFAFFFGLQVLHAQRLTVTGKVTGPNGEIFPGVSVVVKGTTVGTSTGNDGSYSISATSGEAILQFSFLGYAPQDIPVNGRIVINVTLVETIQQIDEVVVVGYGTVKRSDLTGAVASVSAKQLQSIPLNTFEQAMGGRLAGVEVTQSSHSPGGGVSVRVRGGNSINSRVEPLYVVDGFPISSDNGKIPNNGPNDGVIPQLNLLAGINPGDIESIEVLKDASATSIYGARGANGVVLITTKRGKAGGTNVEYSVYYGLQKIANKIEMLDAYQFAVLHNEMSINKGKVPFFTSKTVDGVYYGTPEEYKSKWNPNTSGIDTLPSTDWQDAILRTGSVINHQLTLSGGNENTQYSASTNYFKNNGIIKGGDYSRISFRINVDSKINKWLSVGNNLTFSHNLSNNSGSETGLQWFNGGSVSAALKSWPMFTPYNRDGTLNTTVGAATLRGNPVAFVTEAKNELYNDRLMGNIYGTIKIMEGLTLKISAGTDFNLIRRDRYFPKSTYEGLMQNGSASKNNNNSTAWLNENVLTYNKSFGVHTFNIVAGYTMQQEVGEGSSSSATGFPNDIFQDNNMSAGSVQTWPTYSYKYKWSLASWLGRINYNLNNKYLLTLTGRADGSSKFGEANKWAFFPSIALAWKLSQEEFIKNLGVFSNLKMRLSYGKTGNSEISLYSSQARLGLQNYTFGEGFVSQGLGPATLPNPDLKWETTNQYDAGLELGFIDNRLNFIIDAYYKKTTDLLLNVNIQATSGYSSALKNVGSLENKGMEFTVNYDILVDKLKWNVSGIVSFNRNKILSLTEGGGITMAEGGIDKHGGQVYLNVGLPVGVWRYPVILGIFHNQAEVDAYVNSDSDPIQVGAEPGDVKYKDVDGDGNYDGDDVDIIGDPNPDFIFGITNNFSYKNFELSIFVNGSQGNDIVAPIFAHAHELSTMSNGNLTADMWNRWTPENMTTDIPKAGANFDYGNNQVFDGSFVRVKNIRLTYNIPVKNISWLKNGQIYLNLQNLLTFTSYPGYDPEVNSAGQSSWQRGIDLNGFPSYREIMVGIRVGF
jgi:TonB-linked SusC/RagA family outer membrane protein